MMFRGNNAVQHVSPRLRKPFATGMFMLFEREKFNQLGGFDERALYAEDYLLSKQVVAATLRHRRRTRADVATAASRRWATCASPRMFLNTALHTFNTQLLPQGPRLLEVRDVRPLRPLILPRALPQIAGAVRRQSHSAG